MNQHNAYSKGHALHLRVAGYSETGRLRDHNADAFALYAMAQEAMPQVKLPVASLSKRFPPSIIIRARVIHPWYACSKPSLQPIPVFVSLPRCTKSMLRWQPPALLLW